MMNKTFLSQIDQFHERAISLMGYDNFGNKNEYRSNLEFLLERADSVTNWTDLGRKSFPDKIVGILCSRLSAQKGFEQSPGCLNQAVDKPIIVVGYRSGTTALHKLLSSAPNTQTLEMWLATFPKPRPARSRWKSDRFFNMTQQGLDHLYDTHPLLRAIHFMSAGEAEESNRADFSFSNHALQAILWDRTFINWTYQQDQKSAYAQFKKNVQLIGYGNDDKWILKCPGHMHWLENTLEQFPTATIVNTYRDPLEVIPSTCNTLYNFISPFQTLDKKECGRQVLEYWSKLLDQYVESRATLDEKYFLDISYKEIITDPIKTVRTVFTHCDGSFDAAKEEQVKKWHANNQQGKHGQHHYTAEEYGLSKSMIAERTEKYRKFFSFE